MPSSPDTLWVLLEILPLNPVLGLSDLAWSSRFLQCKWNFLIRLVTVLWSTASSHFVQQISWSIWLLYCDQQHLHLLHNKFLDPSGYCTVINCIFTFCTTNFLIHLVTVLWSTASSPFAQQMFLVAFMVFRPCLNS